MPNFKSARKSKTKSYSAEQKKSLELDEPLHMQALEIDPHQKLNGKRNHNMTSKKDQRWDWFDEAFSGFNVV